MNEPLWLDERDVLTLHGRLLALHGGTAGLRDRGLLQSALARPKQHFEYSPASDFVRLAAIYTIAIARNHPFLDGNKRTAFVIGILFLELNGYKFTASEEDSANAVLALASGAIDENGYTGFLKANVRKTG